MNQSLDVSNTTIDFEGNQAIIQADH